MILILPQTASQILTAAKEHAPRIQLRDIWYILTQMQERHLVRCLNPQERNGKCYCYTELGRAVARRAFALDAKGGSPNLDWRDYAKVVRAKARQRVLLAVASHLENRPRTAKNIRKKVCERCPIGRNSILRALHELEMQEAIASAIDPSSRRKIYRTTVRGQWIAEMLRATQSDHEAGQLSR
jgi:DNA-binding PadR family transcriptional regulator